MSPTRPDTAAAGARPLDPSASADLPQVIALIRSGLARTRPDVARQCGLGRRGVAQRVDQLIASGLVADGQLGPSTGGRAPRELVFCVDAGRVLVCELNAGGITVGLTDLSGRLLAQQTEQAPDPAGADVVLARVEQLFDGLLQDERSAAGRERATPALWAIGIGVLGPVDAATGRPVPVGTTVPGWGSYAVRDRFEARYDVPVWVDNEVNLMALGELRNGIGRGHDDIVYVKLGRGVGAGLISGGRLHRGADGSAGEIGHISVSDDPAVVCACGKVGCLVAFVGAEALGKAGERAAQTGLSTELARRHDRGEPIGATDVADAAAQGDTGGIEILNRAGERVGGVVAMLVNTFNPSLVIVGGDVAAAGDLLLATIRQTVYRRALPLATRNLQVAFSPMSERMGLVGAAFMALDHLFSARLLASWIELGSPAGLSAAAGEAPSSSRVA